MTIEKSIMMLRLFLEYISSFLNYSLAFFHGRGAGNKKVMRVISIRLVFFFFFFVCVFNSVLYLIPARIFVPDHHDSNS